MPVLSVQMKGELERVSKFRRHVVGRTVGIQNTHIPKGQVEVAAVSYTHLTLPTIYSV